MQITKRAIPRVATTGLVLGAAACNSGDATPSSIANDICAGLDRCDPAYFDYLWDSFGQCDAYYTDLYIDYADSAFYTVGAGCEDAFLDMMGCYWGVYRSTCDAEDAYYACLDEYDRFLALCY